MGMWTRRLEEFLRSNPEKSLTKQSKAPSVSFVSDNYTTKRAEQPSQDPDIIFENNDVFDNPTPATNTIEKSYADPLFASVGFTREHTTGACWSCKKSMWWADRFGNLKCGICHPPYHANAVKWNDDPDHILAHGQNES